MTFLPDATLAHLRHVADEPDLSGTKYELVEAIGRGGMATVYRAHDRELDRDVALKVLRTPELDDGLAERLIREARILAALEHPGIVPVHDVGRLPDGRVFYAMKLVRGRRLDRFTAETPDLNERLRVFLRIGEAVAFAHAHGVLHRDLKPENIMVGAFGEVLVMDFGIARQASTNVSRTVTPVQPGQATLHGSTLGTPGWMAPEQAAGDIERMDVRTDVFGLGAILEYLIGRRAGAPSPATPPPARLVAIARRATEPQPARRYESVDAMAADIRRFQDGLPVSAWREPVHVRVGQFVWKYRTPILLVLSYLLMRILLIALR